MSEIARTAQASPDVSARRWLSTANLCVHLGISRETLAALRREPDFPRPYQYVPGGRLLFDEAEIERWIQSRRVRVEGASDVA